MSYQPKPNTWTLFANTRKKEQQHPDYTGTAMIELPDGTTREYRLSAWKRVTKSNVKFLGGFIKLREDNATPKLIDEEEKDHAWD